MFLFQLDYWWNIMKYNFTTIIYVDKQTLYEYIYDYFKRKNLCDITLLTPSVVRLVILQYAKNGCFVDIPMLLELRKERRKIKKRDKIEKQKSLRNKDKDKNYNEINIVVDEIEKTDKNICIFSDKEIRTILEEKQLTVYNNISEINNENQKDIQNLSFDEKHKNIEDKTNYFEYNVVKENIFKEDNVVENIGYIKYFDDDIGLNKTMETHLEKEIRKNEEKEIFLNTYDNLTLYGLPQNKNIEKIIVEEITTDEVEDEIMDFDILIQNEINKPIIINKQETNIYEINMNYHHNIEPEIPQLEYKQKSEIFLKNIETIQRKYHKKYNYDQWLKMFLNFCRNVSPVLCFNDNHENLNKYNCNKLESTIQTNEIIETGKTTYLLQKINENIDKRILPDDVLNDLMKNIGNEIDLKMINQKITTQLSKMRGKRLTNINYYHEIDDIFDILYHIKKTNPIFYNYIVLKEIQALITNKEKFTTNKKIEPGKGKYRDDELHFGYKKRDSNTHILEKICKKHK